MFGVPGTMLAGLLLACVLASVNGAPFSSRKLLDAHAQQPVFYVSENDLARPYTHAQASASAPGAAVGWNQVKLVSPQPFPTTTTSRGEHPAASHGLAYTSRPPIKVMRGQAPQTQVLQRGEPSATSTPSSLAYMSASNPNPSTLRGGQPSSSTPHSLAYAEQSTHGVAALQGAPEVQVPAQLVRGEQPTPSTSHSLAYMLNNRPKNMRLQAPQDQRVVVQRDEQPTTSVSHSLAYLAPHRSRGQASQNQGVQRAGHPAEQTLQRAGQPAAVNRGQSELLTRSKAPYDQAMHRGQQTTTFDSASLTYVAPAVRKSRLGEPGDQTLQRNGPAAVITASQPQVARSQDPHNQVARSQDPHTQVARSQNPNNQVARSQDPHNQVARSQDPHNQVARSQDLHNQVARSQDPNNQVARSQDPNNQVARSQDPHNQDHQYP